MIDLLVGLVLGAWLGASVAVMFIVRRWPRVTVHQVMVTPEAIAKGIVAGGGIHCAARPAQSILVDWTLIHRIVEAEGYRLIAKHENQAGAAKRH